MDQKIFFESIMGDNLKGRIKRYKKVIWEVIVKFFLKWM